MAFTDFYMQATGSNLNSGSTNADAAALTYAGGTFVQATGVFTVASGDPAADGVVVGDWISIYTTAGATNATFISQCTARDATTITVSLAAKYGTITNVSETAAAATAKVRGAWADFGMVATNAALSTGTVPVSTKIHIKLSTYANTTTSRTFALAGATTTPLWWCGYNTTIGDIDAETTPTLTMPSYTTTTGSVTISGAHQRFSGISFLTTSLNGTFVSVNAPGLCVLRRCRIDNQTANAASAALSLGSSANIVDSCFLKATATASAVASNNSASSVFVSNVFVGGGIGLSSTASVIVINNIFNDNGGDGIRQASTGAFLAIGNSFYSVGSDGIEFTTLPSQQSLIANNIFSASAAYDVNNSTGANTNFLYLSHNLSHAPVTAHTNGFGDAVEVGLQADSSSPFVNAAGGNFATVSTSNARGKAMPISFDNLSTTAASSRDIGAVQSAGSGASASQFSNLYHE